VEVCGGGRYDGLARVLGSDRDDQGVGFAFGLERLWQALQAQGGDVATATASADVLVMASSTRARNQAIGLAEALRSEGIRVILETNRNIKEITISSKAMGIACVIEVGVDPMSVFLHDLAGRTRSRVAVADLPGLLGKGRRR
ncbi:MAG: histidine--tRNA ligase family protein, partial [Isosphaeraceae bacterium]